MQPSKSVNIKNVIEAFPASVKEKFWNISINESVAQLEFFTSRSTANLGMRTVEWIRCVVMYLPVLLVLYLGICQSFSSYNSIWNKIFLKIINVIFYSYLLPPTLKQNIFSGSSCSRSCVSVCKIKTYV